MKRLFTLCAIVIAVAVSSCSKFDDTEIWDKLNDHESRITALEELCKQMNTNINALQTLVEALEKRDYITNVSPVRKDGEVIGYTISFADSDTITIYHGENGKDGADGKDGYTPQIGVMKDTDGIYYWTLDGEWLLDGKGNKIQANGVNGIDGTDGSNGQDGTDGVDGITPRLKIENDYWYVSYDDGITWVELGKATGEDGADGSDGTDGSDGDSIFSSVTQDEEYVYFNLADGTMITLPKHDKENIQFEDLQVKAICCKNWDANNDGELSYTEAAAVTDIDTTFKDNKNIIAFTELKYFVGLTNVSESAFSGCENLWKLELPQYITNIASKAFMDCSSIRYINIPNGVETIGSSAFSGCTSLLQIQIPDSVITIEDSAFSGCRGATDVLFGDNIISIGAYAFNDCASLQKVIIPTSVASIGDSAFEGCTSTSKIVIPESVTDFGYYICRSCTGELYIECNVPSGKVVNSSYYYFDGVFASANFDKIVIGNNVTSIGNYAFYNCGMVKTIEFGENISSIGSYAFMQKISDEMLSSVYITALTPPSLSSMAFDYSWRSQSYNMQYFNTPKNLKIYVPSVSVDDYKAKWSSYSDRIVGYDFE